MERFSKTESLSQESIIDRWREATGDKKEYPNMKKGNYLSFGLHDVSVEVEFYPDLLNNNHLLVIDDFSASKGDQEYEKSLKAVADLIIRLKSTGLNFALAGPQGYSDSAQIVGDIEALMDVAEQPNNVVEINSKVA